MVSDPRSISWVSTTVFTNTNKSPCAWILLNLISFEKAPHVLNQSVRVFLIKKSPFVGLWLSLWILFSTRKLAAALRIWCRGVELFACQQCQQIGIPVESQQRIWQSLRNWTSMDSSKPRNRVVVEYCLVSMPPCSYHFHRSISVIFVEIFNDARFGSW